MTTSRSSSLAIGGLTLVAGRMLAIAACGSDDNGQTSTGSAGGSADWGGSAGTAASSGTTGHGGQAGAGGIQVASGDSTTSRVVVGLEPASTTVATNGTRQFIATVAGSANKAVTWSATCGTVSDVGYFTAPAAPITCDITATSVTDPSSSATAAVNVEWFHYVSATGNDETGDGSAEHPWASLHKATTEVTTPRSTIFIHAGDYLETEQCQLAVGVSILGEGDASHIVSHFQSTNWTGGFISLATPLQEGVNGSQSISNLKLDGGLVGTIALFVIGRSNVKIHHCTVVDFTDSGIGFRGAYPNPEPVIYATGNEIYNCRIENSSTRGAVGSGLIRMGGQDGMRIHDNILIQNSRAAGENGNIINSWGQYDKNLRYYNNKSYKPDTDGIIEPSSGKGWNFHLEAGSSVGGMEIYNNEFHGGCAIDIAHLTHFKGDQEYSWWVHENLFALDAQIREPPEGTHTPCGVEFEGTTEDAIVSNNHFDNLPDGVVIDIGQDARHDSNIRVHYNLFEHMGYSDIGWSFALSLNARQSDNRIENIYYDNNVVKGTVRGAMYVTTTDRIQNVYIRNNIIEDSAGYGWLVFWDAAGTIDGVFVQNNIVYNNVNSNAIYFRNGKVVTNLVGYQPGLDMDGNLNVDPKFVSSADFHLQADSPGISAGRDVGLFYDYEHKAVDRTPNIGALE